MKEKFIKFLIDEGIYCLLFIIISLLFVYLTSTPVPIVYWSTSTGKCVSIEVEGVSSSCDSFKDLKRYEIIWIK